MADRYNVVHRPRVELSAIEFGVQRLGTPIDQYCFQIEDSFADGDYIGGPYSTEGEARAACDELNDGKIILYLPDFNRALLRLTRALSTDSMGREIFVGLTREESEKYAELHRSDPSDEFIGLNEKHTFARTGYKAE